MIEVCKALVLMFAALSAATSQSVYAECECTTASIVDSVRQADRVFYGVVRAARIVDEKGGQIEFVVSVETPIRGTVDDDITLYSPLPASCGIPIRLGFYNLFVLSAGSQLVRPCSGSDRNTYRELPLLQLAVTLVEKAETEPSEVLRSLGKQLYSGYDRKEIEEFFELVERIDTSGHSASYRTDRIVYRGIAIVFKDGNYDRVERIR